MLRTAVTRTQHAALTGVGCVHGGRPVEQRVDWVGIEPHDAAAKRGVFSTKLPIRVDPHLDGTPTQCRINAAQVSSMSMCIFSFSLDKQNQQLPSNQVNHPKTIRIRT